jgi:hypothetical protein
VPLSVVGNSQRAVEVDRDVPYFEAPLVRDGGGLALLVNELLVDPFAVVLKQSRRPVWVADERQLDLLRRGVKASSTHLLTVSPPGAPSS